MTLLSYFASFSHEHVQPVTVFHIANGCDGDLVLKAFRSFFVRILKESVQIRSLNTVEFNEIKSELAISFLGQKKIYILTKLHEVSRTTQEELTQFFLNYQGPHIVFIIDQTKVSQLKSIMNFIVVSPQYTLEQATELLRIFFGLEKVHSEKFLTLFVRIYPMPFQFNMLVMVIDYIFLVGIHQQFFDEWIFHIVASQHSLFQLAGSLFSKEIEKFLLIWKQIEGEYSFPFWTGFFSEQFFRASLYVDAMKSGDKGMVQEVSARLPFSFLKQDWKRYDALELVKVHNDIYELEIKFKQGQGETLARNLELLLLECMVLK